MLPSCTCDYSFTNYDRQNTWIQIHIKAVDPVYVTANRYAPLHKKQSLGLHQFPQEFYCGLVFFCNFLQCDNIVYFAGLNMKHHIKCMEQKSHGPKGLLKHQVRSSSMSLMDSIGISRKYPSSLGVCSFEIFYGLYAYASNQNSLQRIVT